ncbi:MAG: hypothetical protein H6721_12130 [Sandaracinus sp.]|nr:hypothetical protein [Sandaracinus sp.]MCB9632869.1 hypothetical protein [Sandaracinus sp.]
MSPAESRNRRVAFALAAFAFVTAALGIWMRASFEGWTPLVGALPHVRHAHSHAGVYGLFFPLAALAWHEAGVPTVGARTAALYLFASAVAVITFAVGGYALPSIVASSVVGAVWLFGAWRARRAWSRDDALRFGPLAILIATAFVPPIAITTRRAPLLAQELVHTFLGVLMLGVFVPAALRRLGAKPSPWLAPLALGAAIQLGPLPTWPGAALVAAYGLGVAHAARQLPRLPRALWWLFALGSVGALVRPHGVPHDEAIAGLHYLLLGPLFVSLSRARGLAAWFASGAAATMATVLVVRAHVPHAQGVVAVVGGVWLVAALLLLLRPSFSAR